MWHWTRGCCWYAVDKEHRRKSWQHSWNCYTLKFEQRIGLRCGNWYLHVKWSGQIISLDGSRICVLGTPLEYSSTRSQCWYYVVEITALVQKHDAIISIKTCGCHFLQNSMFIFGLPNSRPTNGKAIHKNLPFFEEAINAWKVNFGILGGYSTPRLVF
jgi:hypothetical protein